MTATTYPNGRVIDYGTSGNALDAALGRVDSIADDSAPTQPLASYTYMGLSTIVQQLDGNSVGLSYLQQSGDTAAITSGPQYAGDQVTGLGRFGQVIDQNWVLNPTPASTPTPTPTPAPLSTDRTQLAYDLSRSNGFRSAGHPHAARPVLSGWRLLRGRLGGCAAEYRHPCAL